MIIVMNLQVAKLYVEYLLVNSFSASPIVTKQSDKSMTESDLYKLSGVSELLLF